MWRSEAGQPVAFIKQVTWYDSEIERALGHDRGTDARMAERNTMAERKVQKIKICIEKSSIGN